MLFVARLSDNLGESDDQIIPVAADTEDDAVKAIIRIVPRMLFWSIESVTRIDASLAFESDMLIEAVHIWWGVYCDYADGNDSISEAEFSAAVDLMNGTFDAIYDAEEDCYA